MTAQSSPLLYEEIQAMQIYEAILLFGIVQFPLTWGVGSDVNIPPFI